MKLSSIIFFSLFILGQLSELCLRDTSGQLIVDARFNYLFLFWILRRFFSEVFFFFFAILTESCARKECVYIFIGQRVHSLLFLWIYLPNAGEMVTGPCCPGTTVNLTV